MTTAVAISIVLLWILVATLSVVVFALARQIGVLYERVAPAGALMIGQGPQPGDLTVPVRVDRLFGDLDTVGGAPPDAHSRLVFFLSTTCPVCATLLPALRSIAREESAWLRVVLASDGARDEHERFARERQLEGFDYVLSTELGLTYQVSKLPYAVLIDADGILRAKGLVNTREHLESLFEASERGVASIQEFLLAERESAEVA